MKRKLSIILIFGIILLLLPFSAYAKTITFFDCVVCTVPDTFVYTDPDDWIYDTDSDCRMCIGKLQEGSALFKVSTYNELLKVIKESYSTENYNELTNSHGVKMVFSKEKNNDWNIHIYYLILNKKVRAFMFLYRNNPDEAKKIIAKIVDSIYIKSNNYFRIENGAAIITGVPAGSGSTVTIPDTVESNGTSVPVTAIADDAFKGNTEITTVTIGKNVITIGKNAFASCTKLKTVKGGKGVTTIKDSAFSGCKALKSFAAMSKLQKIGAKAFKGCVKLTKFTIGKSVSSIGKNAFNGCKALKTITVKSEKLTTSNVKSGAFKGISSKATFKVPKKYIDAYYKVFTKRGAPKTVKVK